MSVAITRIGDREAQASPTAPSVLAAPGPVVVIATPSLPGRARVAVGGVRGGLLVAHADEADRGLAQRLPEREVVDSGQSEADLDARALELVDDHLRTRGHGPDRTAQVARAIADRGSVARLPHAVFGLLLTACVVFLFTGAHALRRGGGRDRGRADGRPDRAAALTRGSPSGCSRSPTARGRSATWIPRGSTRSSSCRSCSRRPAL